MKVINLDELRRRHQLDQAKQQTKRFANHLLSMYGVSPKLDLAGFFGYYERLSNEEAVMRWIELTKANLHPSLDDRLVPALRRLFEQELADLPVHLQGSMY